MTELRRNLQNEDLLARRAAYVAQRDKREQLRLERMTMQDALEPARKRELQDRLAAEREAAERQTEAERRLGQRRMAARREAEEKDRLAWLQALQKEYDVTGNEAPKFSLSTRKRSFLTPENIDKKLSMLLMGVKSPVEDWSNRARETQAQEEKQQKAAILGGSLPDDGVFEVLGEPASLDRPFGAEVSEAERQADLDAGLAGPMDDDDAEFIDRLRSIMGNLTDAVDKQTPAPTDSAGAADDGDDVKKQ